MEIKKGQPPTIIPTNNIKVNVPEKIHIILILMEGAHVGLLHVCPIPLFKLIILGIFHSSLLDRKCFIFH